MAARPYYLLDVFTATPLAGNPLAVVLDAEGLDDEQMQKIAREFNLSETVFVFEPHDKVNTARLRIFTTVRELPFAGHPTVGTAVLLATLRAPDYLKSREVGIALEEKIGLVQAGVRHVRNAETHAHFTLPALPQPAGEAPQHDRIAAALGLRVDDLGFGAYEPAFYSAGLATHLIPVRDLASIAKAKPDVALVSETFGIAAVYLYTNQTSDQSIHYHARMFGPQLGVFEDPATGASAAALAGALTHFEKRKDGEHMIAIEQGIEMGRPSLILLGLTIEDGTLRSATIGGPAVLIGHGTLDL